MGCSKPLKLPELNQKAVYFTLNMCVDFMRKDLDITNEQIILLFIRSKRRMGCNSGKNKILKNELAFLLSMGCRVNDIHV